MLIFMVILLFVSPSRTDLHTLTVKKHIIFLIWFIAAASLFTLCPERLVLATEWDISPLFDLWLELHMHIT